MLFSLIIFFLLVSLGKNAGRYSEQDLKVSSVLYHHKPAIGTLRKKVFLNINGLPLVNNVTQLQAVYSDIMCSKCQACMDRAVKVHKIRTHIMNNHGTPDDVREYILTNEINVRDKREVNLTDDVPPNVPEIHKTKTKRGKPHKSVVVTKFKTDRDVYALKVKETIPVSLSDSQSENKSTCQVYSVKKSFPCDTPEGDMLLAAAKRKAKKRKVKKETVKTSTSKDVQTGAPIIFKKREVDSSQISETFMPSIEESY